MFGQVPLKKQYECICPNCQRNLAASRFAPHLEKCMGMGRNSSRIASKRIANSTVKNNMNDSDVEEYDNDADWNYYCNDNKKNKRKKEKNGTAISSGSVHNGHKKLNLKHTKTGIINKNGAFAILGSINEPGSVGSSASEGSVSMTYESMSIKEKRAMLLQMCGVISEHTKKMCTRSRRCPQHTEEQRKQIRYQLLGSPLNTSPDSSYYNLLNSTSSHNNELVDLGESLFEGEQSNELLLQDQIQCLFTPDSREVSPADSSSTNASKLLLIYNKIKALSLNDNSNDNYFYQSLLTFPFCLGTSSLSRKNESNSRSNKAKNGKKKLQQFVINSVSNMSSSSSVSSGINEHII